MPEPSPTLVKLVGTFTSCDSGWCLDDSPLDFGVNPDLSGVQQDYDGNGKVTSVREELTALLDGRVRITTDGSGLVVQINRLAYVDNELPSPAMASDKRKNKTAGN